MPAENTKTKAKKTKAKKTKKEKKAKKTKKAKASKRDKVKKEKTVKSAKKNKKTTKNKTDPKRKKTKRKKNTDQDNTSNRPDADGLQQTTPSPDQDAIADAIIKQLDAFNNAPDASPKAPTKRTNEVVGGDQEMDGGNSAKRTKTDTAASNAAATSLDKPTDKSTEASPNNGAASNATDNTANTTAVYVNGISYDSTEKDLRKFFKGCGCIAQVHFPVWPDSGRARGFAYVTFTTTEAFKAALGRDGKFPANCTRYLKVMAAKDKTTKAQNNKSMPTQTRGPKIKRSDGLWPCRQWDSKGSCTFGDKCAFSHLGEEERPPRSSRRNMPKKRSGFCFAFNEGQCTRGDNCRYKHVKDMSDSTTKKIDEDQQIAKCLQGQSRAEDKLKLIMELPAHLRQKARAIFFAKQKKGTLTPFVPFNQRGEDKGVCYDFLKGACTRGADCIFLHTQTGTVDEPRS